MNDLDLTKETMSSVDLVSTINEVRLEEGNSTKIAHSTFLQKVKLVLNGGEKKFLSTYKDASNRNSKCYSLPRRECNLMVMSESVKVQAAVYDKLEALSSNHKLPQNFAQALRLAADLQEDKDKLEAQALLDSPKVKFSDVITESANTRAIRYWIKALKHENNLRVGEKAVFQWLRDNKYIFKDRGQNVPMSKYEANGLNYFNLIVVEDDNGKPRRTMHITGKGMLKLTPKVLEFFNTTGE